MSLTDSIYLPVLQGLLDHGVPIESRAGTVRKLFGTQLRFDLNREFPLLNSKKLHTKSIFAELAWFLRGDSNVRWLQERGVRIWDEWADADGNLGPVYGKQWRSWPPGPSRAEVQEWPSPDIDQIANVIRSLQDNPYGRRHVVTAWNPAEVDEMALPPCHMIFQFNVRPAPAGDIPYWLDCHLNQRSADWFLGVPFNISSYAALTHVIAAQTNLFPGELVMSFGDYHLYETHLEQAKEQLSRWNDAIKRPSPRLRFSRDANWQDLFPDDLQVLEYDPMPAIKAEVSV